MCKLLTINCQQKVSDLWRSITFRYWNLCLKIKCYHQALFRGEDQGTDTYAIIRTPPGATLERTNQVSQMLQKICEEVDGVESVSSLAGYEIMTEGRGSNAGTCLINLKNWSEREHSVKEIMEELEDKSRNLGAVVEFFEPPAVPGFGSSGGFSLRLLDKEQ
ncbi:MAG: efflux RND transporter permease subunit [Cytophagales bacterium]|nr:efflux RND transporter permease subunit [Cytophagales bacterium]